MMRSLSATALAFLLAFALCGPLVAQKGGPKPVPAPAPAPPSGSDIADKIYDDFINADGDPYGYDGDTSDGCYARSAAICDDIQKAGRVPEGCSLKTVFAFWDSGNWVYHQACALECEDGTYVFDGLTGGAMTEEAWNERWHCADGHEEKKDGIHMGPDDDGELSEEERREADRVIEERRKD